MIAKTTHYPSIHRLFNAFPAASAFQGDSSDHFAVDIEETDSDYRIHADVPGVGKDDITVDVEDNVLTVGAKFARQKTEDGNKLLRRERVTGSVTRQFVLPPNVKATKINAALNDGVLTLSLPKGEDNRRRKISIG